MGIPTPTQHGRPSGRPSLFPVATQLGVRRPESTLAPGHAGTNDERAKADPAVLVPDGMRTLERGGNRIHLRLGPQRHIGLSLAGFTIPARSALGQGDW
jgi:hypothetical protein